MAIKLEKFLTKNVVISILVGILIIAGSFWSRLSNSSKISVTKLPKSEVSTISYQKSGSDQQDQTNSTTDELSVANLPNVNGIDNPGTPLSGDQPSSGVELTNFQKYISTPGPGTLPYEEIRDRSVFYPQGVEKYSISNLQKVDTNRASLLSYGKELVKTLDGFPYYKGQTPTEITISLSKSFTDSGIKALDGMQTMYSTRASDLATMTVPDAIAKMHVDLANSFDRTAQLIQGMQKIQTDKLFALNSARQFIEESKLTISILLQMNRYYADNSIDLGNGNKLSAKVQIIN